MKLQDSVVVITGASSGIGAVTARELSKRGAILVLAARRGDELKALADEIDPTGKRVLCVPTDVTKRTDIDHMVEASIERFGRIDALVSNAGMGGGPMMTLDDATIEGVLTVNLLGPIRCAHAVVPYMRKQGGGVIVNIGSVFGEVAGPGPYSVSKYGLKGFSEGLRRELLHDHIAVSLIEPGFIRTPMTTGMPFPMLEPTAVARVIAQMIEHPRRKIIVPWYYVLLKWLFALVPMLADRVMGGSGGTEATPESQK